MDRGAPRADTRDGGHSDAFGDLLRRYRRAAGWTQEELAERARVSPHAISALERGIRGRPWRETIQLLAGALDLTGPERRHLDEAARRRTGSATPDLISEPSLGLIATPDRASRLPVPLTTFIGRKRELAEVTRAVAAARLVTLTGAGGCGKTRLALEVARSQAVAYGDDVWFVDLAPIADPLLVAETIAVALGLRERSDQPFLATVIGYLRSHRSLLVLDNCEHLIDSCASVAQTLLECCSRLTILTTSRQPLGLPGEVHWRVPSLGAPRDLEGIGGGDGFDDIQKYDAVRLFVERGQAVQPSFVLTSRNAKTIVRICQHLDGIPLALELAAARLNAFSVEQIAARLDQRFQLLTTGNRGALPRQQTLSALVDWSYELLSPAQRILFDRLSVFAGGWTLDAAEAVCSSNPLETDDIPKLLADLVEHSLVEVETLGDGQRRYRFLETLRQYADRRLAEADQVAVMRDRHLAWHVGVAERAGAALLGPDQADWLERLEGELDNLRAALSWSQDTSALSWIVKTDDSAMVPRGEAGLRLAGALRWFWLLRLHRRDVWQWLEAALARTPETAPAIRARALLTASVLAGVGAVSADRAVTLAEDGLQIYRQMGDGAGVAQSLGFLAYMFTWSGNLNQARVLANEAVETARTVEDRRVRARVLWNVAYVDGVFSEDLRRDLAEECLAIARKAGDLLTIAISQRILGNVAMRRGDSEYARLAFEEDIELCRRLGDALGVTSALQNLGDVATIQWHLAEAESLYRETARLCADSGYAESIAHGDALMRLAHVILLRGDLDESATLFRRCLGIHRLASKLASIRVCLLGLASIATRLGHPKSAIVMAGAAQALRGHDERPWERAELDEVVGSSRTAVSDEEFAMAWQWGQTAQLADVIAIAMQSNEEPVRSDEIGAVEAHGGRPRSAMAEVGTESPSGRVAMLALPES